MISIHEREKVTILQTIKLKTTQMHFLIIIGSLKIDRALLLTSILSIVGMVELITLRYLFLYLKISRLTLYSYSFKIYWKMRTHMIIYKHVCM